MSHTKKIKPETAARIQRGKREAARDRDRQTRDVKREQRREGKKK